MNLSEIAVGTELPPLRIERVTRRILALFAGGSNDHQPVHIDIDAARVRGRDDVIAHGMLSMAYMGRLLTDWAPQDRIRSYSARFAAIMPVNAEPSCAGKIIAIDGNLATVAMTVTLADGTVTAKGEAVIDIG